MKGRIRNFEVNVGDGRKRETITPGGGTEEIITSTRNNIKTLRRGRGGGKELGNLINTVITSNIGVTLNPREVDIKEGASVGKGGTHKKNKLRVSGGFRLRVNRLDDIFTITKNKSPRKRVRGENPDELGEANEDGHQLTNIIGA
jgi:hypothetical protein